MQPTPGATPAPSSQGLTLAEHQALRGLSPEDIAEQITGRFGFASTGHFWWNDPGRRSYVVCPPSTVAAMSLAVVDDFGDLVPVPSIGAHAGHAGAPA